MKSYRNAMASLCLTLAFCASAWAQDYDLVINGGRVMDPETMYDDIANVGIKGGRIALITKDKRLFMCFGQLRKHGSYKG